LPKCDACKKEKRWVDCGCYLMRYKTPQDILTLCHDCKERKHISYYRWLDGLGVERAGPFILDGAPWGLDEAD